MLDKDSLVVCDMEASFSVFSRWVAERKSPSNLEVESAVLP